MTAMEWIRRVTSTKYIRALESDVARLRAENRALLTPMRRRSWQQIYRMLEINSARKKQDAGEII